MTAEIFKSDWPAALGKVPSGLFIVTTPDTGFLASWVQQCGFKPPQITIAVANDRPVLQTLTDGAPLGLNVLPEGSKALIGHFGKGFAPGEAAFEGLDVEAIDGQAVKLNAAMAWLELRVASRHVAGDHTLVIATVVAGEVVKPEQKPTIHTRRDAARY